MDKNFPSRFSEVLAERRLTQQDAARLLETGQSTISQWISGSSTPRPKTLLKVAAALKVCPVWLAEGKGERTPDTTLMAEANAPEIGEKQTAELTDWEAALQSIAQLGRPNMWALVDRALSRLVAHPHTLAKELPVLRMLLSHLKAGEGAP